jgi:hypothetical protein
VPNQLNSLRIMHQLGRRVPPPTTALRPTSPGRRGRLDEGQHVPRAAPGAMVGTQEPLRVAALSRPHPRRARLHPPRARPLLLHPPLRRRRALSPDLAGRPVGRLTQAAPSRPESARARAGAPWMRQPPPTRPSPCKISSLAAAIDLMAAASLVWAASLDTGLGVAPKTPPGCSNGSRPRGSPWRSPPRGTAAIRAAHAGAAARGGSAPAPAGLASGRVRPGIGWRGDATPSLPFSCRPAYVLPHLVEAAGRRHLELHASPRPAVNDHSIGRAVSIACSLHSSAWPSTTPTSSAPRLWKGWSGHPCPTRIACRRLKGVEQVVNLTSKTLKVRLLALRN